MWMNLGLGILLVTGVSAIAKVKTTHNFEFPDENGPIYNTAYSGGGDNPLVRQGISNGTVISVPNSFLTTTFTNFEAGQQTFPQINPGVVPLIVNNQTCTCVPTGQCTGGTTGGTGNYGDGNIDVRIISNGAAPGAGITSSVSLVPSIGGGTAQISSCPLSTTLQLCCLAGGYQCGRQYPAVAGSPTVPTPDSAYYGQFPWQVVLLTTGDVYVGSGVLIDNLNVLTVAHRVLNYRSGQFLKIRLGEWDASGTREPIPAQEYTVTRVTVHPQFIEASLRNDLAVLRLATAVPLGQTPTIATACLTSQIVSNQRCFVSGWGRNAFVNGQFQTVQKQTDVPLVDQTTCENQLRGTRLGSGFTLDRTSFICAGGEAGKDACTGDGGSPLVCNLNGRWFAVGLVAWGIGCASSGVPGVYVNLASYIPWIQQQISS